MASRWLFFGYETGRSGRLRPYARTAAGPLADGLLDDRVVVCPLHGFTYDLTSGEEVSNGGAPACAYDVSLDSNGNVRVGSRATG